MQALLNYDEDDAFDLVRQIRACESLEELADGVLTKEKNDKEMSETTSQNTQQADIPKFEAELSGRMGDLLLEGSLKFVGGTSNLVWMPPEAELQESNTSAHGAEAIQPQDEAILSWTTVTQDMELIIHLINLYFTWHYAYFTTLSKELFYRDFLKGRSSNYCSALLVNAMLTLGCHFSTRPEARADPEVSATTGDHFFKETKRLMFENDEHTNARLCTVQALALMSVREAGCGREGKGWVYSGMSFRMACDLGLNVDAPGLSQDSSSTPEDMDARRITFWGCFLFDKCWSNYLGRQPQLPISIITVPKPDVFPGEESALWSPYTDSGVVQAHTQPARTRAIASELSKLCEISSDLLIAFYHPSILEKPMGKQQELKKLTDLHTRLEAWKKTLPQEMEAREGQLAQVLLMHMFFQLLFIHLYRPFLKYTRDTSPLPAHVSPRKFCTQAAAAISKLLRLYKRTYGLRQICNIAVYIVHSACTIHILNLPDKNAKRDIVHGVRQLEEIGECWTCARRTLRILELSASRWKIEVPEEATATFQRCRQKWGTIDSAVSPVSSVTDISPRPPPAPAQASPSQPKAQISQPAGQTQAGMMENTLSYTPNGLFQGVVPSPVSPATDGRRSSGGLSLPPATAADLNRMPNKQRPSTYLTQAQQEAWKAHQAGRVSHQAAPGTKSASDRTPRETSPSILFGGVESLVEESQDWWLRDQSALALGFDNWVDPAVDWTNMDTSPSLNGTVMQESGLETGTNGNSDGFNSGDMVYGLNSYANGYQYGNEFTPGYPDARGPRFGGQPQGASSKSHQQQRPEQQRHYEDTYYG